MKKLRQPKTDSGREDPKREDPKVGISPKPDIPKKSKKIRKLHSPHLPPPREARKNPNEADWLDTAAAEIEALSPTLKGCGSPIAVKLAALLLTRIPRALAVRLLVPLNLRPHPLRMAAHCEPDHSIGWVHFVEKARLTLANTQKGSTRLNEIIFGTDSELPQDDAEAIEVACRFFKALARALPQELVLELNTALPTELRQHLHLTDGITSRDSHLRAVA